MLASRRGGSVAPPMSVAEVRHSTQCRTKLSLLTENRDMSSSDKTVVVKDVQLDEINNNDVGNLVDGFIDSTVVARVPLWSTLDCDNRVRTRLDVRQKRIRRLALLVKSEREARCNEDAQSFDRPFKTSGNECFSLRIDPEPLLNGSIEDPWSKAIAALDAGLFLGPDIVSHIFACPGEASLVVPIFYILWKCWTWREIPKCYGRYNLCPPSISISAAAKASRIPHPAQNMTPTELVSHALEAAIKTMSQDLRVANSSDQVGPCKRVILPSRDPIILLPFLSGGGLISYEKLDANNDMTTTRNCRYVHTLNSPSGWSRKISSLGLDLHSDVKEAS